MEPPVKRPQERDEGSRRQIGTHGCGGFQPTEHQLLAQAVGDADRAVARLEPVTRLAGAVVHVEKDQALRSEDWVRLSRMPHVGGSGQQRIRCSENHLDTDDRLAHRLERRGRSRCHLSPGIHPTHANQSVAVAGRDTGLA